MDKKKLKLSETPKRVILRAFKGEPIVRYVSERSDGAIMVRNERSYQDYLNNKGLNDWIGWPRNDIYDYDATVFEKLLQHYKEGDEEGLNKEWEKLKRFF